MREEEIIDIICILDNSKATGPDKISNKMIISIKNEIAKPPCLLFNKSLHRSDISKQVYARHKLPRNICYCRDGLKRDKKQCKYSYRLHLE